MDLAFRDFTFRGKNLSFHLACFAALTMHVYSDPGASDDASAKGMISLSFGKLFEKGLSLGTGQCNVKAYNRYLRDLIIAGKAKPSFVVSHEINIDDAEVAYEKFDKRIDGYTKVLIHPNGGF